MKYTVSKIAKTSNTLTGRLPLTLISKMNVKAVTFVDKLVEFSPLEKTLSSQAVELDIKSCDATLSTVKLNIFSESAFGKLRTANDDGAYIDNPAMENIDRKAFSQAIDHFTSLARKTMEADPAIGEAEEDDMKKLVFQRIVNYGRHVNNPLDAHAAHVTLSDSFLKTIDRVIQHLCSKARAMFGFSIDKVLSIMIDPDETNTGAPFFFPGAKDTDLKRLAILSSIPSFDFRNPDPNYLKNIQQYVVSQGLPSEVASCSFLVYRTGPKYGEYPVWYHSGGGFRADYQGKGFCCHSRFAFGGAYWFYIVTTPLVTWMKLMRKAKPGLYHTIEDTETYFPLLFKSGSKLLSTDFSAYDTTQSLKLQRYVFSRIKHHMPELSAYCDITDEFLKECRIFMPNLFFPDTRTCSVISGNIPLLSGLGFTSELGTILSISSSLDGLSHMLKRDIVQEWIDGKIINLVQSDDNLFALQPKEAKYLIDGTDDYKEYVRENHGFKVKMSEGAVFLKRLIFPGVKSALDTSPLFARILQQTFGNEDRYISKFDKIIVKYGLLARSMGINRHPYASTLLKPLKDVLMLQPAFHDIVPYLGESHVNFPPKLLAELQNAMTSADGQLWLDELLTRSSFDPIASSVINFFQSDFKNMMDKVILDKKNKRQKFYAALHPNSKARTDSDLVRYKMLLSSRVTELLR